MTKKKKEPPNQDHSEIISYKEVEAKTPHRVKVKIKERIPQRKKKIKLTLALKVILLLIACMIGFIIGSRVISRYLNYWNKPRIKYHPRDDSEGTQLKAGEVYSITPE